MDIIVTHLFYTYKHIQINLYLIFHPHKGKPSNFAVSINSFDCVSLLTAIIFQDWIQDLQFELYRLHPRKLTGGSNKEKND